MKRFVYLDTDELNSYIAQIYNGLAIEKEEIKENKKNIKKENSSMLATKLNMGAKIKGLLNFKGEVGTNISDKKVEENDDVIKDIQKKIIHDESFDNFLNYLKDKKLVKNNDYKVGDFVMCNSQFKVFDLNYFLKLFEKNGLIDFLNKNNRQEAKQIIETEKSKLNRAQRRDNQEEIKK